MNADTSLSPRGSMPYRNTHLSISVGLQKYSEYFCRPTEIQNEYFCRPTEIQIEYFCRVQRHYYTNFRCQTWTWNQGPNMGNDVRGREKI